MAITRDLSDLPGPADGGRGFPPDAEPRYAQVLVEQLAERHAERGDRPTAYDTRVRHSDAGKCARAIAYAAAGIPRSNPMDLVGEWSTSLGSAIHDMWQEALVARGITADIEPKVQIDGLDASGHADAVITAENGRRILYELKTTGGFSYKLKVGERGPAEGPPVAVICQSALNAMAVDADELIIGYLATEAIGRMPAQRKRISELGRIVAEWSFTRDEYMPVAQAEVDRLRFILDLLDTGLLAARNVPGEMPADGVVVDPRAGRWEVHDDNGDVVDAGTFWGCDYCSWRDVCATTGPGAEPVSVVIGGDQL